MDPSWFSLEQTQCVLNDQVQLGHTVRRVWTTECHCPSWPCPNWSDKFGLNQELVYVQLRTCMTIQNAWWFVLCGNLHRRRKHDRVASLTWGANTSCGNAKCNHKRIMKDQFRCACVCVCCLCIQVLFCKTAGLLVLGKAWLLIVNVRILVCCPEWNWKWLSTSRQLQQH